MVFERKDMPVKVIEKLRGGTGSIELLQIVPPDALPSKSRLFSIATLQPGCSIGIHEHTKETEIYFVIEGEGTIHDNGHDLPFKKGDCNVCGDGSTHGITNTGDKPLVFLAAIILE